MARFIPNAEIHRFGGNPVRHGGACGSDRGKSFSLAYQNWYVAMQYKDYFCMTFSRTSAIGGL